MYARPAVRINWKQIKLQKEQEKNAKYVVVLKCGYEIFCNTLEEAQTSIDAYAKANDEPKLIVRG